MLEYITSGESHGKGIAVTVTGIPSGIVFNEDAINVELAKRQSGYGRGGRMAIEKDKIEVISGVRNGKTIGSPVTMIIWNKDWENWKDKKNEPVLKPRPGHADLTGAYKYGLTEDIRDVLERSSARETAGVVAAGALVGLFLNEFGISIFSHVVNWGGIEIDTSSLTLDEIREMAEISDIRSACSEDTEKQIKKKIDECKAEGNTIGGIIETVIYPAPPFLGSYQTAGQKLDSKIASRVLSVQAIKGIEFGLGFKYAETLGKDAHDEIYFDDGYYRKTNHAGGIEGGMSNGNAIVFRAVMKPIPTLMSPLNTVNIQTKTAQTAVKERSDITAVAAAGVVIENIVAFDIADAIMARYGSDNLDLTKRNFDNDPSLDGFCWRERYVR
jgi:chorismate synthase